MARNGGFLHKILVWSYDRGTLPYDIICALILGFIFLTPRACFAPRGAATSNPAPVDQVENR